MQTSHKLTRIFVALFALIVMAAAAIANPDPTDISVSDQKAGNVLVFPYYNSSSQTKADTRVTISNLSATRTVAVHLFFLDKSCNQADTFVCLTPNASIAMKASEFDPEQLGWLLAVAVDSKGVPADGRANFLIGNAFVSDGDYVGNYGAEAFTDVRGPYDAKTDTFETRTPKDNGDMTATLSLQAPTAFAIELQSPVDAPGQRIVTVGLAGNIFTGSTTGAGQVGTGVIYNGNEKPFGSFSPFLSGNCRADATIMNTVPRVPLGLSNLIPTGHVGTMRINVGAAVGLLMTSKAAPNKWSGIRSLHKTAQAWKNITIPTFLPGCGYDYK